MAAPLVFYPSRARLLIAILAGLALSALFIFIIFFHDQWSGLDQKYFPIAVVGLPLVILTTLYWVYRFVRRAPLLTINGEGIIDHSSFVGAGLVKWSEMKQITIRERKSQSGTTKLVNIVPIDIAVIKARQNALTRLNELGDNDTIQIGTIGLPLTTPQLYATIQQYYMTNIHAPTQSQTVTFQEYGG